MKVFTFLPACCLTLVFAAVAMPASAYMKFTYTSPELPVVQSLYDGEPWDYPEYWGIEPLSFSLSFTAPEQDLSLKPVTHFFMDDFTFELNATITPYNSIFDYPMRVSPASYGRVSLNSLGEVVGWNLIITITELITLETDIEHVYVADHWETILSRNGGDTCNCDLIINRVNVHTWHRVWIQLSPLQFDYSNVNSAANWTIERVPVPEPIGMGLLLTGLVGVFGLRRRARRPGQVER